MYICMPSTLDVSFSNISKKCSLSTAYFHLKHTAMPQSGRNCVFICIVAYLVVQFNSYCIITVYPKKYAHGFVVLCFVVVMQSFIMNSHEVFIHIHQGCFAGTGAIVRLQQCQWSKPDGYGKISQCITAKQKPCAYFLGYTVLTRAEERTTSNQTKIFLHTKTLP